MSDSSRRGFLKVAGAGAAVAGAAVVTSHVASAEAAPAPAEKVALPRTAKGAIVAHVDDVRSGRISLLVEGHEVSFTDHELVARLATALHKHSPRTVNDSVV